VAATRKSKEWRINKSLSKNKTALWCEVLVFGLKGRFIQPRPSGRMALPGDGSGYGARY
jgi:hypothetical protein